MESYKISYSHKEELWNSWTHAAGILLGVTVGAFWLAGCIKSGNIWATFSISLYLFGMLMSYISSTSYHATSPRSRWKERLRKLDHSAIYWHIAGSYSPIMLIALRQQGAWGWSLFAAVWLIAITGTLMSFRGLKPHSNLETICYVGMGLMIMIAFKPLIETVSLSTMLWIIVEGVAYVTGAVFYSFHKRHYMHTVFHFFVLLGTICHMIAIQQIMVDFVSPILF